MEKKKKKLSNAEILPGFLERIETITYQRNNKGNRIQLRRIKNYYCYCFYFVLKRIIFGKKCVCSLS